MKKWLILPAAGLLASCSQSPEPAPEPSEPAQAITPGIYDVVYETDGSAIRAVLDESGAYRSYDLDGTEVGRGNWSNVGQRTCFEPTSDAPPVCYTDDPPGEDGSFNAVSDDGRKIYVRPVPDAIAGSDTAPIVEE
ncbi:hypothetical protein ACXYL9_07145 [Qipengyuania sp. CAU 1752]